MLSKILTFLCCVVLTAGMVGAQSEHANDPYTLLPGSAGEPVTDAYPMPFPARGGDVDWGLALSGGGLRSAAFSIGAMKALYDLGLLDDIDVISSVSGGGYASYWLYSRYDGRNDTRFGADAFGENAFPRNVCTLARKSEFFPLRRMIKAIFSPRDKAFLKYRNAIEWSFGFEDGRTRAEKRAAGGAAIRNLQALLPQIESGRAPYFILNTTIDNEHSRGGELKNEIDKTFEIGPTYRGSSLLKFADWPTGDASIKTWCDAVAMSGAAIRFKLSRRIPNFTDELTEPEIDLADGGLSENLAALPLIQRGIKNIVIVDAENDPGYKFESYYRLREYLRPKGIALSVKEIDDFIVSKRKDGKTFTRTAVAKGTATYAGGVSNIFYIKMSRPASIFPPELRGEKRADDSELVPPHRRKFRPAACPPGALAPVTRDSLRRDMLSYSRYLNKRWFWRHLVSILPYINYNFPQITTIDQTFYSDQLEAFIGLGYLEAIEMKEFVGPTANVLNR
jgi:hypothetical protein